MNNVYVTQIGMRFLYVICNFTCILELPQLSLRFGNIVGTLCLVTVWIELDTTTNRSMLNQRVLMYGSPLQDTGCSSLWTDLLPLSILF